MGLRIIPERTENKTDILIKKSRNRKKGFLEGFVVVNSRRFVFELARFSSEVLSDTLCFVSPVSQKFWIFVIDYVLYVAAVKSSLIWPLIWCKQLVSGML
jgi:hypothetical protein